MKSLLGIVLLGFGLILPAQADELPSYVNLYRGDVRVLSAPGIERLAVGDVEVVNAALLKNQEVVLTADKEGETTLQVWFADGHREQISVVVVKANGYRQIGELRALFSDVPGIKIRTVGRQVVIEGKLHPTDVQRIKDAVKFYDNVLVLVEEQSGAAMAPDSNQTLEEVRSMLGQIPGISIKSVGRQIVIDGELAQRDLDRIDILKARYPDILMLAQPMSDFVAPMIYFDVRITEFAKNELEELGINWSTSINGPGITITKDFDSNAIETDWGIASAITSRINFLETTGAAITLASPRLSARSGGKAELTVGGEVPVVTSSINGPSVEYKDFGIILSIEPQIYGSDRIAAKVGAEISQLDKANQVGDYPAFKTRRTDNEVQLNVGETLVLAGLVTRDEQTVYEGVKWLQDVPVLGPFFRNKSFKGEKIELVIFITPKLMVGGPDGPSAMEVKRSETMLENFDKALKHGMFD